MDGCSEQLWWCAWAKAKGIDCPDFQVSRCLETSAGAKLACSECMSACEMTSGRHGLRDNRIMIYLKGWRLVVRVRAKI